RDGEDEDVGERVEDELAHLGCRQAAPDDHVGGAEQEPHEHDRGVDREAEGERPQGLGDDVAVQPTEHRGDYGSRRWARCWTAGTIPYGAGQWGRKGTAG